MRLPVPDRFATKPVILFCVFIFLGQLFTGTDLSFSLATICYIIFAVVGFNVSGGLYYASGAYIFFNAVLTSLLGLTYKIFLGEAGQATLRSGDQSMLVYAAGMFSMMVAAILNSRLRPKRGLLADLALGPAMKRAALGCLIFGIVLTLFTAKSEEGTIGSAFRQVNRFLPMAILLGASYELQLSNGRRGTNWIVNCSIAFLFLQGLVGFSKEGMFLGPAVWLVCAIAFGYDFRRSQLLVFSLAAFLANYYLVPYSQYVRVYGSEKGSRLENVATAARYLGNLNETRRLYLEQQESTKVEGEPHLFSTPQGFLDRLNMLAFDDAIITITEEGSVFGLQPTILSYANVLPHFIWRDKPHFAFGNVYAHEIGLLDDEDVTTGISFSPIGDAYHQAAWLGVLVVWPGVVFLFFFATDSLTGSAKYAPWALLPISQTPHIAPEGMMAGVILLTTYGIFSLLAIVFFARYLLPIATSIFGTGKEQKLISATVAPGLPGSRS